MEHVVDPTVYRFAIFVLAIFVGYYVVWSVTPALHTPLMSVTNAISSVIVVGALLAVGAHLATDASIASKIFGFLALVLASVNIFGGPDGADPAQLLARGLAVEGAHVHLYGKGARPGRKLGHVTVCGDDAEMVRARAWSAALALGTPVPPGIELPTGVQR